MFMFCLKHIMGSEYRPFSSWNQALQLIWNLIGETQFKCFVQCDYLLLLAAFVCGTRFDHSKIVSLVIYTLQYSTKTVYISIENLSKTPWSVSSMGKRDDWCRAPVFLAAGEWSSAILERFSVTRSVLNSVTLVVFRCCSQYINQTCLLHTKVMLIKPILTFKFYKILSSLQYVTLLAKIQMIRFPARSTICFTM